MTPTVLASASELMERHALYTLLIIRRKHTIIVKSPRNAKECLLQTASHPVNVILHPIVDMMTSPVVLGRTTLPKERSRSCPANVFLRQMLANRQPPRFVMVVGMKPLHLTNVQTNASPRRYVGFLPRREILTLQGEVMDRLNNVPAAPQKYRIGYQRHHLQPGLLATRSKSW